MKRAIFLLLALMLAVCLAAGCHQEEREKDSEEEIQIIPVDQSLENCLEAVVSGQSGSAMVLGTDGQPAALTPPGGLAGAICQRASCKVQSLEERTDTATATLEITAPDAVPLVRAALEGMTEYDEAVFTQNLEALLAGEPAMKTFTVTVELRLVDSQWCLVPNREFSNAITGGLIEEYEAVRQSIADALAKGGEQE